MSSQSNSWDRPHSEWLNSLTPEDRVKYRESEKARQRKYYQDCKSIMVKCVWCDEDVPKSRLRHHERRTKRCLENENNPYGTLLREAIRQGTAKAHYAK